MSPPPFSVLLPVYGGDDPAGLRRALDSVLDQTVPPAEVLVVVDGSTTDPVRTELGDWAGRHETVRRHDLDDDRSLGAALRVGVRRCDYDLVARMDADDVSVSDRFERQTAAFADRPELDVIGGVVVEFDSRSGGEAVGRRSVPTTHEEIRETAPVRNPFNHPTVMFRREAVLDAGNYRDVDAFEDYDLWLRMLRDGARTANLDEVLVRMDTDGLYDRRGGVDYLATELSFQWSLFERGLLREGQLLRNLAVRAPVRLLPGRLRRRLYRTALRD